MKRIALFLMIFFCVGASARAADVDAVLSGLQSYWQTLDTFTARFVQTKHLALLSGDVTSRGTFAYKKPGDMVFRYDTPDNMIFGIMPKKGLVTYYYPDIKKATRIHLSSGADVPPWMSFGMGPMGDISALKKTAAVTVAEAGGATVLTIAPRDPKGTIKDIVVTLRKDYTPLKVRIVEKNGDFTTMDFSDQRVNPAVSGSLFEVKIPSDVVVEDIRQ